MSSGGFGLHQGSAPMYGLKLPARCLCAVAAPTTPHQTTATSPTPNTTAAHPPAHHHSHHFLVGTCSLKEENELHVLEFDEEENEIKMRGTYSHPQEIIHLSSCPHRADICATTYPIDASNYQATVWKLSSGNAAATTTSPNPTKPPQQQQGGHTLQRLFDLKGHTGKMKGVVWNPVAEDVNEPSLLTLDSQCVRVWELNESSTELKSPSPTILTQAVEGGPNGAAWDPHHSRQFTACSGRHLKAYDLRQAVGSSGLAPTINIDYAHEDLITDLDYNPNKPFHLLSTGYDRRTHLWDLRRTATPIKTLQGHTHWIWTGKFNRFHDQLILTAGTEQCNLWNIFSVSSAPIGELETTATTTGGSTGGSTGGHAPMAAHHHHGHGTASVDSLIKSYNDHEDSVYSGVWSSYDAWLFATLSYDGRIVMNHVPPAEKYRILL